MDLMVRREALLGSLKKNDPIAYEAYNLSFDGTTSTVINTGVYLFTAKNINRDFEVVAEGIVGNRSDTNTIICAKHNGKGYGFLVRINSTTSIEYNGTIFVKPTPNSASIIVRRQNGVITVSGTNIMNPGVNFTNDVFDWPLVLGCAINDDGTYYRYAIGHIDHILVKWT